MARATDEARATLVKAADDMAWFYDVHWHEAPRYSVGDKVWLSSENIRTTRPTKKLDYKWLGPYTINWVISRNAYRLKLPVSFGQVHPVFSLTLLLLRAVPESTRPGVRVGRVWSSGGRGFSERVAAPTRLSCPGFSRGKGSTRRMTASRAVGQGGYECRVGIYFHGDVIR